MTILKRPVSRRTGTQLGGQFGTDHGRPLVVSLIPNPEGDLISLRPLGTRREESVRVEDVYQWILRCKAARVQLERARAVRDRNQERKRARQEAARRGAMRRMAGEAGYGGVL